MLFLLDGLSSWLSLSVRRKPREYLLLTILLIVQIKQKVSAERERRHARHAIERAASPRVVAVRTGHPLMRRNDTSPTHRRLVLIQSLVSCVICTHVVSSPDFLSSLCCKVKLHGRVHGFALYDH